jgi:hypothetical protein
VPESILNQVTLGETQAFATDVAGHIASAQPGVLAAAQGPAAEGAIISLGNHVIVGIPPAVQIVQVEK